LIFNPFGAGYFMEFKTLRLHRRLFTFSPSGTSKVLATIYFYLSKEVNLNIRQLAEKPTDTNKYQLSARRVDSQTIKIK